MKTMKETAQTVKVNSRYDLTIVEMRELYSLCQDDILEALSVCFKYGYEKGRRATLKEIKCK